MMTMYMDYQFSCELTYHHESKYCKD